jgi:hypothetical protein
MSMPGFNAESSLDRSSKQYVGMGLAFAGTTHAQILPQQREFTGSCTGFWPFNSRQCVRSSSGRVQCCGGSNQYPYIREFDDGSAQQGCAICLF